MAVRGCWLESFSFQYGGPMYLLKFEKALNETVDVVLDHQQDAKKHGQAKGNDILASVRVIGSYLAEAPIACKEKVTELVTTVLFTQSAFCFQRFVKSQWKLKDVKVWLLWEVIKLLWNAL
ncbi:uncharacterized protein LOC119997978 isoform X4 [Tripterygium wilfordii]|uniref:uncharacterized protein LOC119997978 isoform X4 n=1 Tax=Tripterygium wilfordii TaxID=458696 RepID=UPI0018F84170|nr:uncharacterized protein LOC119997978 isoform X4 [Tripterygium wilfordii]